MAPAEPEIVVQIQEDIGLYKDGRSVPQNVQNKPGLNASGAVSRLAHERESPACKR
jgi:hypothetical protein